MGMTVQCAEQVPPINVSSVVTSDNCGGQVSVIHTGDIISDQVCINSFTLTRNYLATDICGNAESCVQIITILDDSPPEISFVDPLLLNGDTLWVQCFGQNPNWDLPFFDEGSVLTEDFCTGAVSVVFDKYQQGSGTCENGIIRLFRLSWKASDLCGNSDSLFISIALFDTISPVIFNVPADVTLNCNEIPPLPENIYATDECLCACVVLVEESGLIAGCQNGQVMVRSWTATDQCGNQTTATQTITLVDDTGPEFLILQPEILGISNGTVLNYSCSEGGIPAFFGELSTLMVLNTSTCGGSYVMSFTVDTLLASDCEALGFVEQRTYTWVAVDDCINLSTMSIYARLIDTEAPIFTGVPDITCLSIPGQDVDVSDDCGQVTLQFQDFQVPNPCGNGSAIQRIYKAFDNCGNSSKDTSILIPNAQVLPFIEFTNPTLAAMEFGDTLTVNCEAQNGQYTPFGIEDVHVTATCGGSNLTFTEELLSAGDCEDNGIVMTLELRWTATDLCGNSSERIIIAQVVDDSSPVFVDFLPDVSIGCNDELPQLYGTDNCGDVTFLVTWDTIIYGACVFEHEIQRLITATDACANTTTQMQIIHVGNGSGPTFEGIIELVCDDTTIPQVTAFDDCSGQFVDVAMEADTLDSPCTGMIIERTWTAIDSCGNISSSIQTIIVNDTVAPEFVIPFNSFIYAFLQNNSNHVYLSDADMLLNLNQLDSSSAFVEDDCEQAIFVLFTVDTLSTDCLSSGYFEQRTYTWEATDYCGNTATLTFTVYLVDDVPPVFTVVPVDKTIVCDTLPAVPPIHLYVVDQVQPVTVVFSETIINGDLPGSFVVSRILTATDACGNVSVYIQTITWIPDTMLECNIIIPDQVACNTHDVLICTEDQGSTGGNSYHWEILGEDCFIQGDPDSSCVQVYIGWSPEEIILTVTDSYGCVSTCSETLDCEFDFESSFLAPPPVLNPASILHASPYNSDIQANYLQNLHLYPNPALGRVYLSFESMVENEVEFSFTNLLGVLVSQGKISAQIGINTHQVDIGHLPEGSYLMQIKTREEMQTRVIVVLRND